MNYIAKENTIEGLASEIFKKSSNEQMKITKTGLEAVEPTEPKKKNFLIG